MVILRVLRKVQTKADVLWRGILRAEQERETSCLLDAHAARLIDLNGCHMVPSYCMTWISKVHPTNVLASSALPWGCSVTVSESLLSNAGVRLHRRK